LPAEHVAIVGAGIFGVTAARALLARGYHVTLLDPGPIPHPLAASTDISKAIRMDYGSDLEYTRLMEQALEGWRRWNRDWPEPLYHECGVTYLSRAPMAPGGFEYESYQLLTTRGHQLDLLDSDEIRRRFPAWNADRYPSGYFNPHAGYAESGRVVARLLELAESEGARFKAGRVFARLVERGSRVAGLVTTEGETIEADIPVAVPRSIFPPCRPARLPPSAGGPLHVHPTQVLRLRRRSFRNRLVRLPCHASRRGQGRQPRHRPPAPNLPNGSSWTAKSSICAHFSATRSPSWPMLRSSTRGCACIPTPGTSTSGSPPTPIAQV
jgi:hypothetical protein